jgi:hypothetical protein
MKEITVTMEGDIIQAEAQQKAESLARRDNPDTFVISRFNRKANACSPCCLKGNIGDKPGWEIYGENHGGRLKITVNDGEYVFILS